MRSSYHHGDLRNALVAEAGIVLEEVGAEGLTFRGLARRLGVSHAAPGHHFSDRRALLQELAAQGYQTLSGALRAAAGGAISPDVPEVSPLSCVGLAYVTFGLRSPQRYRLMFTSNLLGNDASADLVAAAAGTYLELLIAVGAEPIPGSLPHGGGADADRSNALSAWSLVHGLVMLLIDGQLGEPPAPAATAEFVLPILARLR